MFSSGEAQDLRSKAFGAFSKNGNTIDFRDFVMVIVIFPHHHHYHHGDDNTLHMKVIHLTSNGSAEEKVRLMFRMYDKNGNGSIDEREMNE